MVPAMPKTSGNNCKYVSVMMQVHELAALDAAAAEAGVTRNRFVRNWIASLRPGKS